MIVAGKGFGDIETTHTTIFFLFLEEEKLVSLHIELSADTRIAVDDKVVNAESVQLLAAGKTRWTGADDGHLGLIDLHGLGRLLRTGRRFECNTRKVSFMGDGTHLTDAVHGSDTDTTHTVIDQHLFARQREADLLPFIEAAPAYVGIGIDESTAVLVERDSIRVAGLSKVALYLPGRETPLLLKAGEGYDLGSVSHVVAAGESLGLGSTSHSPAAGESDASAQEIAEDLRSGAENGPAAQENGENLRSEAENVPAAQENGENLRSGAENVPAAQENGENLRSEAENVPAAHEIAENLRSEAENVPAAHEIAENLRSGAENGPAAQEIAENLRKSPQAPPSAARTQAPPSATRPQTPSLNPPVLSRVEKGEFSRAEKGELSRAEKDEFSRAEEDTKKVLKAIEGQLIDPPLHALRLESEEFRWQQLIVPGTLLAAGAIGTYSTWYRDHINIPVRDRMSEWTGGRQLHFDDYILGTRLRRTPLRHGDRLHHDGAPRQHDEIYAPRATAGQRRAQLLPLRAYLHGVHGCGNRTAGIWSLVGSRRLCHRDDHGADARVQRPALDQRHHRRGGHRHPERRFRLLAAAAGTAPVPYRPRFREIIHRPADFVWHFAFVRLLT